MNPDELVVYEDAHLIGLNKPAGMPSVHAGFGPGGDPDLQELVSRRLGTAALVVHRLDRATSGIVVFAKDRDEHRRLSTLFEQRAVRKTYLAVTLGHVDPEIGVIDLPLRSFGSGRVGVDPNGAASTTAYELQERLTDADLLAVFPRSGRRHQVRAHLNAIGHPVLGDPRYGHPRPVGGEARLMLHALQLELTDAGGTPLTLRAEPGGAFDAIVAAHRRPG